MTSLPVFCKQFKVVYLHDYELFVYMALLYSAVLSVATPLVNKVRLT